MSKNSDGNNVAGGVAAAVAIGGALIGAGLALWKYYDSSKNNNHTHTPPPPPPPPAEDPPRKCPICEKDFDTEHCVTLDCDHEFHKNCILANYVLHIQDEDFKCPICHIPVSQENMYSFLPSEN